MKIEILNISGTTVKLIVEINGEKHHASAKLDNKNKILNIGVDNDIMLTSEDLDPEDLNQYNQKIQEFLAQ